MFLDGPYFIILGYKHSFKRLGLPKRDTRMTNKHMK